MFQTKWLTCSVNALTSWADMEERSKDFNDRASVSENSRKDPLCDMQNDTNMLL